MNIRQKVFWTIASFTALRLAASGSFELALDEGYYWVWSRHLSLSYYDHPPMVAVTIWLTTLFGNGEFFVRLGSVLGAAASSWLLFRLTVKLSGDEKAGLAAVWIANLALIFCAGGLIISPDTPLVPFYLLALLLFLDATEHEERAPLRWCAAGAAVGLAMLSKYTAVFFFPGAFLYLFLTPRRRHWLLRPHPYLAALAAFIVFSPVIVWNAQNHWASFAFQGRHGLAASEESGLKHFLDFIGMQAAAWSIGLFFFLVAGALRLLKDGFATHLPPEDKEPHLFLFAFALPTLGFFTLNSFRATVEGNWPILGFLPLLAQAGIMAEKWDRSRAQILWRGSIALAALLVALFHVQIVDPIIPHPKRFEISRRIYGWKQLAAAIDDERKNFDATFVIGDRFQTATLMTFYTSPHLTPYMFGPGNATRFMYQPPPDTLTGKNAFYLAELSRDESARLNGVFERVEKAREIEIIRRGELIRRFALYRCYNYRSGLNGL
ncbi:MAG: glycosyltransferase family 39 protein [Nitrospinae bacterium]|nr:glycosyltransferase family 39 protein [Nitrospinota bacterium]